jgi:hypothetical protein
MRKPPFSSAFKSDRLLGYPETRLRRYGLPSPRRHAVTPFRGYAFHLRPNLPVVVWRRLEATVDMPTDRLLLETQTPYTTARENLIFLRGIFFADTPLRRHADTLVLFGCGFAALYILFWNSLNSSRFWYSLSFRSESPCTPRAHV